MAGKVRWRVSCKGKRKGQGPSRPMQGCADNTEKSVVPKTGRAVAGVKQTCRRERGTRTAGCGGGGIALTPNRYRKVRTGCAAAGITLTSSRYFEAQREEARGQASSSHPTATARLRERKRGGWYHAHVQPRRKNPGGVRWLTSHTADRDSRAQSGKAQRQTSHTHPAPRGKARWLAARSHPTAAGGRGQGHMEITRGMVADYWPAELPSCTELASCIGTQIQ